MDTALLLGIWLKLMMANSSLYENVDQRVTDLQRRWTHVYETDLKQVLLSMNLSNQWHSSIKL